MKKTDEDCLGKKQENIGGDNSNKKKDDGKKSIDSILSAWFKLE